MNVVVVGLGRIGLPIATLCGQRGHDVLGVDHNEALLRRISTGDLGGYDEPGLDCRQLAVTTQPRPADVAIICVGTTSARTLDVAAVHRATEALVACGRPQLLIIVSTVEPGTCTALADRHKLLVAHCPERSRPGEALAGLAELPRLVGGVNPEATSAAMSFWGTLTQAPLLPCTADEAALAKLAENAEREVRIAFANELADAASAAGVDPDRVAEFANSHPRTAVLRHGIGVGGTCLPMATRWFAMRGDGVAAAARALHERRPRTIAARLATKLPIGAKICVLGRTYRPDVSYEPALDDYDAPSTALIAALREQGFEVTSWDPSDTTGTRAQAEAGADLVLVAVPHAALSDSIPCS